MRRRLAVLLAASALAAWPAAQAPAQPVASAAVEAVAAHECGKGYTHAKIGGEHKCLRRGQFCAKRYRKQYKKYGFTCAWDGRYYRLR